MNQIILLAAVLFFARTSSADKYKDSFVEAAHTGNIMLVKTHINDLKGRGKERHNEALRAAVNFDDSANTQTSSRFKGKTTDVVKLLLASSANPNDQSFGRPTIFSTVTNAEVKALLKNSGGRESVSDQLAAAVKQKNLEDFEKALALAQPAELKLGVGIHIPTLIFESFTLKSEGDLITYEQNPNALIKMYLSLINSKKATDFFVIYEKTTDSEFGRREKTQTLVGLFLNEERWDLLEILVEQDVEVPDPIGKMFAEKWFNYRSNLLLSLSQKPTDVVKDENFKVMNAFFDAPKIKKFDEFAKRLPQIEQALLDQFFLEVDLPESEKLKFFEEMNWKVSADVAAKYLVKIEKILTEQEFKVLERLTNKNDKKINSELIITVFETGNIKTAQQLLRLGAAPDASHNGENGICIAIKKNNFQLAQLLLSYKATVGGTCAVKTSTGEAKDTPLETMEMTPQMRRLLLKK